MVVNKYKEFQTNAEASAFADSVNAQYPIGDGVKTQVMFDRFVITTPDMGVDYDGLTYDELRANGIIQEETF